LHLALPAKILAASKLGVTTSEQDKSVEIDEMARALEEWKQNVQERAPTRITGNYQESR
jgi:hypothetical protein